MLRGIINALVFLWAPFFLRGWHGTRYPGKGSETRPDVVWGSVVFACQAWHNVHCQGIFLYALASLGVQFFFRDRFGTMYTAKGCDIPPASLGVSFLLRGRHGSMCAAKGFDLGPGVPWDSAAFA